MFGSDLPEYLAEEFVVSLSNAESVVALYSGILSCNSARLQEVSPFVRLELGSLVGVNTFGVSNIWINPVPDICLPNILGRLS